MWSAFYFSNVKMQYDEKKAQSKKIKKHNDWNLIFLPLKSLQKPMEYYLTMSLIMMVI